ncbi:MAG TPA: hypothetical protein VJ719_00400 [Chthoniobacterales bacterium]|nr:hypothetical protein [Chthoniobacterales bacterium]
MRWILILLGVLAGAAAYGQTASPSPARSPDVTGPFWRCELPGGIYEVLVRAMVAVSTHQYVVDGVARVTEVNVDTTGNAAVRFYYIEPAIPKAPLGVGQSAIDRVSELAKEAAQKTDQDDVWKRVIKTYPTTTHTHTVEYRVGTDAQLKSIFSSAQTALETQRGAILKIGD